MQIRYATWDEIDKIDVQPGTLYSFDVHPKLDQEFSSLLAAYMRSDSEVLDRFYDVQREVKSLLSLTDSVNIEDAIINDLLVEVEWIIEEPIKDSEPYVKAQIMTYASLLSSRIAYKVLNKSSMCKWLDSRDIIITNDDWLQSEIDLAVSLTKATSFDVDTTIITSHGIGCTADNENTLTRAHRYWDKIFN